MKISKIILALFIAQVFCLFAFAQTPCTKEMAYQTVGKWGRQKKDDLAMADRTFPKEQYKPVLAKANKVIELFKLSNPEFKGIEARAYRGIRGNSLLPNGALPFRVDIGLFEFYCAPGGSNSTKTGKIRLGTESGTWVYFYFNSFGWVLESLGGQGDESLFYSPKQIGNLRGMTLLQPSGGRLDVKQEAVIITPNARLPYKLVFPKGGKPVAALDRDFFNSQLSRSAIQFITIYWG
jgi:hypothetical protein